MAQLKHDQGKPTPKITSSSDEDDPAERVASMLGISAPFGPVETNSNGSSSSRSRDDRRDEDEDDEEEPSEEDFSEEASEDDPEGSHSGTSSFDEQPQPWHDNRAARPWQTPGVSCTSYTVSDDQDRPLLVHAAKTDLRPHSACTTPASTYAPSCSPSLLPSLPPRMPPAMLPSLLPFIPPILPSIEPGFGGLDAPAYEHFTPPCVPGFAAFAPAPHALPLGMPLAEAPSMQMPTSIEQLVSFAPAVMLPTAEELENELHFERRTARLPTDVLEWLAHESTAACEAVLSPVRPRPTLAGGGY